MNSGLWACGRSSLCRDDAFSTGTMPLRRVHANHSSAEADDRPEAHRRDFNRRPGGWRTTRPCIHRVAGPRPRTSHCATAASHSLDSGLTIMLISIGPDLHIEPDTTLLGKER